jgi:hypothetical protein
MPSSRRSARRRVHLRRRQRLADRWRLELVEDALQGAYPLRQRKPVFGDGALQLGRESELFVFGRSSVIVAKLCGKPA